MTEFSEEDPEGELPRHLKRVGLLNFAKYGDSSESSSTTSPEIFASRDDFRGARTLACRVETRLDACRSLRQSQAST